MSPRASTWAAPLALTTAAALLAGCSAEGAASNADPAAPSTPGSTPTSSSEPLGASTLPPLGVDGRAELAQGRYRVPVVDSALSYEVDVPEGWHVKNGTILNADDGRNAGAFFVAPAPAGTGVAEHPCTDHSAVAVGPGVDDLTHALRTQPVLQVTRPVPVTLDGAEGQSVEVRIPTGYDSTPCEQGQGNVALWGTGPGDMWSWGSGYLGQWWVLEVEDQRIVVMPACTQPCDDTQQTLRTMAESIEFVGQD